MKLTLRPTRKGELITLLNKRISGALAGLRVDKVELDNRDMMDLQELSPDARIEFLNRLYLRMSL